MRPGVQVTSKAASAARGEPTGNDTWFVTGMTEKGPHGEAVSVRSLDEFRKRFGGRASYSFLHDALDLAFNEGLATAVVSRVVGPAPVKAFVTLLDRAGVPVQTLRVEAIDVGDYANGATGGLSVTVEDGTQANTFRLVIENDGVEVERFDNLANPGAAVVALATSDYVRAVDLASATAAPNNNPAVIADANLAGGTDDHAAAVEANWTAALGFFPPDLGSGQVSAPGRTTQAAHEALLDHAAVNDRTAYLDVADKASKAALLGAVAAVEDRPTAEFGGFFGTWKDIPAAGSSGTRAVPATAYAAGVTARTDRLEGTSGAAPAGEVSTARYAIGVRTPEAGFSDDDYSDLNDAGINMSRAFRNRGIQLYGFVSASKDPDWVQLTATRLRVSLMARMRARGYKFTFRYPNKKTFADLGAEMTAELLSDYNAGALYGESPAEAFRVDVGDTVNTIDTIAAKEINGIAYARFTPFADLVRLGVVKVPITSQV